MASSGEESNLIPGSEENDARVLVVEEQVVEKNDVLRVALDAAGYGLFHVIFLVVAGWGIASDAFEIFSISFVVPVAKADLHLDNISKGAVDSIIFVGMMIGGFLWGSLSDTIGRRASLIISLLMNGLAGLGSAFMPSYQWFLLFRLVSGIGVGGSFPVVYSYFYEFLTSKKKGPLIITLASFWSVGQFFVALLAWAVLSQPCSINVPLGLITLRNWRVFIILCTLPALSSALFLLCMPESPAWLLEKKKFGRFMKVILKIKRINNACCYRRSTNEDLVNIFENLNTQSPNVNDETEEDREETKTFCEKRVYPIPKKGLIISFKIIKNFIVLFTRAHVCSSVIVILVFWSLGFGYYGLLIWLPEYFQDLQNSTTTQCIEECGYNVTLHKDCSKAFLDSVIAASANLPGQLTAAITINLVGGKFLFVVSMAVASLSVFFFWFIPANETSVVAMTTLFSGFSIVGWNALDYIIVEGFPTKIRSTAFGTFTALGRIASITAIFAFAALRNTNPGVPILTVALMVFAAGVAIIFMPPVKDPSQQSLLRRKFPHFLRICYHRLINFCR